MNTTNFPVLPIPQPQQPPASPVLINATMWARRFSNQLGIFVPEHVLSTIMQDVQFLRDLTEAASKFGFEAKVPPPSFDEPAKLDFALLAIFDNASDLFRAGRGQEDSKSKKMRTVAAKTHNVVRRLRKALRQGADNEQR